MLVNVWLLGLLVPEKVTLILNTSMFLNLSEQFGNSGNDVYNGVIVNDMIHSDSLLKVFQRSSRKLALECWNFHQQELNVSAFCGSTVVWEKGGPHETAGRGNTWYSTPECVFKTPKTLSFKKIEYLINCAPFAPALFFLKWRKHYFFCFKLITMKMLHLTTTCFRLPC